MDKRKKLICSASLIAITICMISVPITGHVLTRHPRLTRTIQAWWQGAEYLGEEGVIRQKTAYDCGAVCLQMILDQKGVGARLEDLRSEAGTTRTGTSLLGLKLAAERFGIDAAAWRLTMSDLSRAPLPAIAFVDKNHFVVITEANEQKGIIVLDPARGRLLYSARSFAGHWTGEILIVGTALIRETSPALSFFARGSD